MTKTIFSFIFWCFACFVSAIYETDVLVNLTLTLVDHYPSNCIELIHKTNFTKEEREQVFQLFKALASRTKETIGVYSYALYARSKFQIRAETKEKDRNCLNPVKYVIGGEDSRWEFSKVSLLFGVKFASILFQTILGFDCQIRLNLNKFNCTFINKNCVNF